MRTERDKMISLLESKIENIIRDVMLEKKPTKGKTKREKNVNDDDVVSKDKSYKKQYKAIEKALNDPAVNATGVMSSALGVNLTKNDSARSHAFKQLHKEKTPDGSGTYEFTKKQINAIFNRLP